jgi:ribosomal protein RSM22 (predicted rRNA methylase)
VRDVPKSAGAVRELVATGALALTPDRPLHVLDLGAGMGASTWGLARALAASGASGEVRATWVDESRGALDVGAAIVRARGGAASDVRLTVETVTRSMERALSKSGAGSRERYDVVLLGQVLSELDRVALPEARVKEHAAMIASLLADKLEPSGALVIIEPALRDRTRHLHHVRDALLAGARPPTIFAPCLHAASCPALAREVDWCHEDLEIDLPSWLVPVARAAGLRYQGLTFSYLVLRRDGRTLAGEIAGGVASERPRGLRVVSDSFVTKGKREVFMCGDVAPADAEGAPVVARARVMRLDREHDASNAAFDELRRGDIVDIDPLPKVDKPRVSKGAHVTQR